MAYSDPSNLIYLLCFVDWATKKILLSNDYKELYLVSQNLDDHEMAAGS